MCQPLTQANKTTGSVPVPCVHFKYVFLQCTGELPAPESVPQRVAHAALALQVPPRGVRGRAHLAQLPAAQTLSMALQQNILRSSVEALCACGPCENPENPVQQMAHSFPARASSMSKSGYPSMVCTSWKAAYHIE